MFPERAEAKETATAPPERESEQEIEQRLEEALGCPCIAEYKEGVCGKHFVEAFSCFVRAPDEKKGSACVPQFLSFQQCTAAHWEHFESKIVEATHEPAVLVPDATGAQPQQQQPQQQQKAKAAS